jgi:(p)ppGpp synthase/HD superfamily hydrolase
MLMTAEIQLARDIATSAHRGQVDKIKAPYIEHPAMVAFLVQLLPDFAAADASVQEAAVCAAWLHDTVEDTEVTADSLTAVGFAPNIVTSVVALTRTPQVEPDAYYAMTRSDAAALLVKTADLASNLALERVARLDSDSREWFEKKYFHALKELGVDRSVIAQLHELAAARQPDPATPVRNNGAPLDVLLTSRLSCANESI